MAKVRDTFCSFCGTAYGAPLTYPRSCGGCGVTVWANPIPVCVVLVPLVQGGRRGLLVVRRGIEPQRGKVALVGGFLEEHERWQDGAAREVVEETAVVVDPNRLEDFGYSSTSPKPNRVLLFSVATAPEGPLPPHVPNAETMERGIVFGPDGLADISAFSLHLDAALRWFAREGITGPHDYTVV